MQISTLRCGFSFGCALIDNSELTILYVSCCTGAPFPKADLVIGP